MFYALFYFVYYWKFKYSIFQMNSAYFSIWYFFPLLNVYNKLKQLLNKYYLNFQYFPENFLITFFLKSSKFRWDNLYC